MERPYDFLEENGHLLKTESIKKRVESTNRLIARAKLAGYRLTIMGGVIQLSAVPGREW